VLTFLFLTKITNIFYFSATRYGRLLCLVPEHAFTFNKNSLFNNFARSLQDDGESFFLSFNGLRKGWAFN